MRQTNYTRFKNALEEQKTMNFINLKKDIDSIKCFKVHKQKVPKFN